MSILKVRNKTTNQWEEIQAIKGEQGDTGVGITSITKTGTSGYVDTYTITFSDGTTSTYEVTNGEVSEEDLEQRLYDNTQMLYNALPTTSGNGEEITLDGTAEVPFRKMDLKGNTYQETTTGSTLSDFSNMEETINGLNIKWNENNMLTLNGSYSVLINSKKTGRLKNSVTLKAGTTYYLHARAISGNYSVTNASNANVAIVLVSSTSNQNLMRNSITCLKSGTPTFSTPTYTPSEDIIVDTIHLFIQYAPNDIVYNNFKVQYCLTTDTTPKYEPYTGNQPSPSPDYPQDIQVVSGDNSITIANNDNTQSQTYPINLGNIELCKIGDYQDKIYKDSGKWYLEKKIGKVVLDGDNKRVTYADVYNNIYQFFYLVSPNMTDFNHRKIYVFTNFFKGVKYESNWTIDNSSALQNNGNLRLNTSKFDNANDFNLWLTTHNLIAYYVLATPTTTEITDTTLISQLEALEKAYSYDAQTYISQTNQDKPFIIDAEAILNMKYLFNDLETRIAVLETE